MDAETSPDVVADRYVLVERVGQGGMAQVWRATDRTLEREVAVKTIDIDGEDHDQTLARFRREAIATAGLSNMHVVSVFDAGITHDRAFLVMELLEGPSLAPLLKAEPPVEVGWAVTILGQVARGLGAAHEIGITHRDIKPGNIVLHRGQAKIVDFGIARLTESLGEALTKTAAAIGTASYMSPEQAMGQPVGPASDIYALGAVAVALLTGAPPFTGGSVAVARAHVHDPAPRLRSRRPDVDPALDELVAAMLVKEPAARPSAGQVSQALQQIAQAPPPAPRPPSSGLLPFAAAPPTADLPATPRLPMTGIAPAQPAPVNAQWTAPDQVRGAQWSPPAPASVHAPFAVAAFPPPPPGSVPVHPAAPGEAERSNPWWMWAIVGVLGIAAVVLLVMMLSNA